MDDLERGGIGRDSRAEGGVALGRKARGIAGSVNLHGGGVRVEVEEEEEGEEEEGSHGEDEEEEGGSED